MIKTMCVKLGLLCGVLALIAAGCGKSDTSGDKGTTTGGTATPSDSSDSMLFDPEQGKFSVRAPGTMKEGHAGGAGGKVYTLTTPTLTYTVGYSETNLPADAAPQRIDTFLDAAVSELQFESDSRTVGEPKSLEISGAPGKEIELEMKDKSHRRIQFIVSAGRLYRLEVAGTGNAVVSADAERFLHSFKLGH